MTRSDGGLYLTSGWHTLPRTASSFREVHMSTQVGPRPRRTVVVGRGTSFNHATAVIGRGLFQNHATGVVGPHA